MGKESTRSLSSSRTRSPLLSKRKELKDVYTKVQSLRSRKARSQETQDKLAQITEQHNSVVDGLDDLKGIYKEAVESQNHFF